MLFSIGANDFESEKERNLYYKFFTGYYFNELIQDYEKRLAAFCELLNSNSRHGAATSKKHIELTAEGTHVSFDNHGYLFKELNIDHGEFADILIHDHITHVMIPIEAKVHSNWSYEKDIVSNERRLALIEDKIKDVYIVPCLLVTKYRWEHCEQKESNQYSNYKRFIETSNCRTRVIFWEELINITDNDEVRLYMNSQLERPIKGFHYIFKDDWFVRFFPNTPNA